MGGEALILALWLVACPAWQQTTIGPNRQRSEIARRQRAAFFCGDNKRGEICRRSAWSLRLADLGGDSSGIKRRPR